MHRKSFWIIGIFLSLSAILFQPSFGADCTKAKDIYSSAIMLVNYEQRADAFRKAVELCPSYAEAHVNLADAYENLARNLKGDPKIFNAFLDKAMNHYQEALKFNGDLFPAYLGLGDTYRVMGLYENSEQAYRRSLELKPHAPKALAGLEKIAVIKTEEQRGFRSSEDIVRRFKRVSSETQVLQPYGLCKPYGNKRPNKVREYPV